MIRRTFSRCESRRILPAAVICIVLFFTVSLHAQKSPGKNERTIVQAPGWSGENEAQSKRYFWERTLRRPGHVFQTRAYSEDDDNVAHLTKEHPHAIWMFGRNPDRFSLNSSPAYATNQIVSDDSVELAWMRQYASERAPSHDEANAIAVDGLGNVYVTGYSTKLPYGVDFLTIKYNSMGEEVWSVRYDNPDGTDDIAVAIAVDAVGNAHVTGYSGAYSERSFDYLTIKYDTAGKMQWVTRYNGPEDGEDRAGALVIDGSGNVYVTGSSGGYPNSDYATVKYNASGVEQWAARYGGPGNGDDSATALAIDDSGNVYITGQSFGSDTFEDYATLKYDSNGIQRWVARYNGPGNARDRAAAIGLDHSGNIYVTGGSYGLNTSLDYATVRYSSTGVERWVARYNGPANEYDYARSLAVDPSGNVYVTGASEGPAASTDFATLKYDSTGVAQWTARDNGLARRIAVANKIVLDDTGNVYVTGYSQGLEGFYDFTTFKYDSSGFYQWGTLWSGGDNMARDMAVDASGNIFVTGRGIGLNDRQGDSDFFTVKYNAPRPQWHAYYNGVGTSKDGPRDFVVDGDGNVYVTGTSYGRGTQSDYATVKYDTQGKEQWAAHYNGPGDFLDWPNAVRLDPAGNVCVTGRSEGDGTRSDYATIMYNSEGVEQWVRRYNGTGNLPDEAFGLQIAPSGNVYVTGSAYHVSSSGNSDYTTIKYSLDGVEQWVARYDGPGNTWDQPAALVLDASENIYVTGLSEDVGYDIDYATVKYDSAGVQQWQARYSGPPNSNDYATLIELDGIGNVYVTGESWYSGRWETTTIKYDVNGVEQWLAHDTLSVIDLAVDFTGDVYLLLRGLSVVKYNTDGAKQWVADFSASGQQRPRGVGLALDPANNIYALGTIGFDSAFNWTVKYSPQGEQQWITRIDGWTPTGIAFDDLGNLYAAGYNNGISWSTITTAKYVQDKSVLSISDTEIPKDYTLFQNYPNPFNQGTTIRYALPESGHVTLKIYNLLGEEVETLVDSHRTAGVHEVAWTDVNMPSGVYVYRLQSGSGISKSQKLVLLK